MAGPAAGVDLGHQEGTTLLFVGRVTMEDPIQRGPGDGTPGNGRTAIGHRLGPGSKTVAITALWSDPDTWWTLTESTRTDPSTRT